jgi:hypothetical protein
MPAKIRALVTMSVYGAAGGTLLGLASLAFDAPTRSIAQGASLGLYAGIIFGSYIVTSHMIQNKQWGSSSSDSDGYYPESSGGYDGGYYQDDPKSGGDGNRWEPVYPTGPDKLPAPVKPMRWRPTEKRSIPIYLQLLQINF